MKLDAIVDTLFETKLDFIINSKIRLMARSRAGILEAGYVFAPYVPLLITPTFMTEDFQPKKGIISRYAGKVRKEFYGTVNVLDLTDV